MSEKEQLASLSCNERRFLSRRRCALCEWPLHKPGCRAIFHGCDEESRIERRKRCLETYKPRRRKKKES